jgi:hypothetical protein
MHTLANDPAARNPATAVERLSDHLRMSTLPWPAKRLARHHGLHAATAATIAELIGYALEARR